MSDAQIKSVSFFAARLADAPSELAPDNLFSHFLVANQLHLRKTRLYELFSGNQSDRLQLPAEFVAKRCRQLLPVMLHICAYVQIFPLLGTVPGRFDQGEQFLGNQRAEFIEQLAQIVLQKLTAFAQ